MPPPHAEHQRTGVAFLVAQVGALAADRFAQRAAELDLTPPQAGLLRAIARHPGSSQRELGTQLGLYPSRVVTVVDRLEERGLVCRERSSTDRRQYALHLTEEGQSLLELIGALARAHDRDLCQSLDEAERATLAALLERIADQQGLTPGVHPGFHRLNAASNESQVISYGGDPDQSGHALLPCADRRPSTLDDRG